jgi:hypothetical protein
VNEFDDAELAYALRRKQPPDGFAEGVLRLSTRPATRGGAPPAGSHRFLTWAAAAALVGAVAGGIQYYELQQARAERARGEAAKEQVMQALRLTADKLHVVQTTVKRIGS